MATRTMLFFILTVVLTGCRDNAAKDTQQPADGETKLEAGNSQYPITAEPARTVINCIYWYNRNAARLNELECAVTHPCPCYNSKDTSIHFEDTLKKYPYFSINFDVAEKRLGMLTRSHFYSKRFIDNIRNSYRQIDDNWKKNPESTANPAEEFEDERDLMLFSMMFQFDSVKILQSKVIRAKQSAIDAELVLRIPEPNNESEEIGYKLLKQDGNWLIDSVYDPGN
jgi:hypothetical protein